ncbi:MULTISPECIES: hypothetical protein [unclassified Streptomyces]|uniref:hypothetical protein n=1 Tax=unclassified Streptomyces TaxID=2593676 RepID=UPI002E823A56|nr:hypothetical protein [Streptomyces sp. NBC_00589]WTI42339.1 hypothetical protein OIC96_49310 [Streptomyces sp. NBC_00775]WUB23979.1 hypothetical protein OHA51_00420 [Streptomyces sp. NBC_00589]
MARRQPAPRARGFSVTGAVCTGVYGLARAAYETHHALRAFGLIDVTPDLDRHHDGEHTGYQPEGRPPCRRVTVTADGLRQDAAARITDVLNWYAATADWGRSLSSRLAYGQALLPLGRAPGGGVPGR